MTAPAPDRRTRRHEQTKREIEQAAWQLARDRGLGGWSLRDVADVVGMRAPSLYVYFRSKNALYDALYASGYRALLEGIAATPHDGDGTTMLRRAAHQFFDFCVEDPARHQLLFLRTVPGFVPSSDSYALAQQALAELADVLQDAGASGARALDLYTALLTGLASQQVSNDPGGDRWSRLVDDAVDMYIAAHVDNARPPAGRRTREG